MGSRTSLEVHTKQNGGTLSQLSNYFQFLSPLSFKWPGVCRAFVAVHGYDFAHGYLTLAAVTWRVESSPCAGVLAASGSNFIRQFQDTIRDRELTPRLR
jgi:hypothetical protein